MNKLELALHVTLYEHLYSVILLVLSYGLLEILDVLLFDLLSFDDICRQLVVLLWILLLLVVNVFPEVALEFNFTFLIDFHGTVQFH